VVGSPFVGLFVDGFETTVQTLLSLPGATETLAD
jgi:hypothetical protein